jgi:nucleoside-diphosphate-sugar epimerase
VAHLRRVGHEVDAVGRRGLPYLLAERRPAGHVVCCIGLTADFRIRKFETAEAHVAVPARVLAEVGFESFLYLSSTRVYARAEVAREDAVLPVQPAAASDLYNLTKLAGEAVCLSDPRPGIRVARLSNVYGPGMGTGSFLGQVLDEGEARGNVVLRQGMLSAKDYVAIDDVVVALAAIAERGRARLYNVASGNNVTHDAIATVLGRAHGWNISVAEGAASVRFPRIDVNRLRIEFGAPRRALLDDLPGLHVSQRQEVAC